MFCAICQGNSYKDVYTLPKCSHKFHKKCITDWVNQSTSQTPPCPLCNTKIDYHVCVTYNNKKAMKKYKKLLQKYKNNEPVKNKKIFEVLAKLEQKFNKLNKEWKEWKEQTPTIETKEKIYGEFLKRYHKKRSLNSKIVAKKLAIGYAYLNH